MTTLTVCITTYERWARCLEALASVVRQEGVESEIILVDDCCSTPPPIRVRRFLEQHGVRYIRHERNTGLAVARNSALEHARGTYFSFCDDDDVWPEGLAADLVDAIRRVPKTHAFAIAVDGARRAACEPFLGGYPRLTEVIRRGITPPVSSQLYETEVLRALGGYNPAVKSGVDHDLWISLTDIDPLVSVTWRAPAHVGRDPNNARMTTDDARMTGIMTALEIWKPRISRVLGEGFYRHFVRSYRAHIQYMSFRESCRRREYTAAFRTLIRGGLRPLSMTFRERLLRERRCNLFPEYRGP